MAQEVKNPPANAGDAEGKGSVPGWGRSPGEGKGYPRQYSCLENSMDRGAWWATVHKVAESDMTEQTLNVPLMGQHSQTTQSPVLGSCCKHKLQYCVNPRTHRLPLCRVPGWGAVEAVTSLHRGGLGLATQLISQDYCFIYLSGKQVGAEDISGLQPNPTGETARTPLANFPPVRKAEEENTLRTRAQNSSLDAKCYPNGVKTPMWLFGKVQPKLGWEFYPKPRTHLFSSCSRICLE